MLVVIVVVYAVCTFPWHVTWLLSVYGFSNSTAKKICVLLVMSVSAAHPIIYGTLNQDFARGYRKYAHCICWKKSVVNINSLGRWRWRGNRRFHEQRHSIEKPVHDFEDYNDKCPKESLVIETVL